MKLQNVMQFFYDVHWAAIFPKLLPFMYYLYVHTDRHIFTWIIPNLLDIIILLLQDKSTEKYTSTAIFYHVVSRSIGLNCCHFFKECILRYLPTTIQCFAYIQFTYFIKIQIIVFIDHSKYLAPRDSVTNMRW